MRTWIGGGFLATTTAAALGFVLSERPHPSHVGPCLSGSCNVPVAVSPTATKGDDVLDVIPPAVHSTTPPFTRLPEPRRLPFVNFDEPPLAATVVPASATDAPDFIPPATD